MFDTHKKKFCQLSFSKKSKVVMLMFPNLTLV